MYYCKMEDEMKVFAKHTNGKDWVCVCCRYTTAKPLKKRPRKKTEEGMVFY